MEEQKLERRLRTKVQKRGGKAVKFTPSGMAGMPDRLVLFPGGRIIFVELKAPGETLRPLQQKRRQQLEALGFQVCCLDSMAAVENFLKEVVPE